ncbi:2OG-Fe(II) oxygenase [Streptomyces sp. CBMA152]|uniref:2OG-Fe(II) oxygenase n=1 Tax=Streptomyces sp. CBMA152 TaxID=1896312 RepID=UPI00166041B0|nr:2OG-Fe(II) oxygenase [Streptomyces sp. CBMA152]MBD0741642.1 hypothetical protein [Streptomyces sp. CBMA152]
MIHISETLGIHTVEDFLSTYEMQELARLMDQPSSELGRSHFGTDRRSTIHEIPGHTAAQAQAVYEPVGRIEMADIPSEATGLLDNALRAALPKITRALPSVTGHRPWIYLEYGPGQHVTPHADGIAPDPLISPRQVAAATVTLDTTYTGGAFYVETTGSDSAWTLDRTTAVVGYAPGMCFIHDGTDLSSSWFRSMTRTRWTTTPAPGTLTLFGSQLIHGTEPVRAGRVRKFLTLLIAE